MFIPARLLLDQPRRAAGKPGFETRSAAHLPVGPDTLWLTMQGRFWLLPEGADRCLPVSLEWAEQACRDFHPGLYNDDRLREGTRGFRGWFRKAAQATTEWKD